MDCRQDLRFALRGLIRQPGFAAIAIATLALGIGVNTAIFTVVNAVVLQPLPFPEPERLVRITGDLRGLGTDDIGMSPPELFDYRDRADLFENISGVYPIDANLTEVDRPERVEVLLVSPSYFSVLGARAQLGRIFGAEDEHPGIAEVAVISHALWQRRFGGAQDVVGRKLRIDSDWFTIVGVMPPGFRHPGRSLRTDVEMWAPAGFRAAPFPTPSRRGYFLSGAIARLKPGVSVRDAQERMEALAQRIRREYPAAYPERARWRPHVIPLQDDLVGGTRPALLMLFGAVGLVLLIACANIAGLMLARAAGRQRELAVRLALGAGRARIARLMLAESLLLAAAGGALGVLLAAWSVQGLLALVPAGLPRLSEVGIDGRVMAFTAALAVLTGILFGGVPAVQASSPDLLGALRDGRSLGARTRTVTRSALVIAELALAMVLLVGAALLARSFWQLQQVDAGFDGRQVLTAQLWLPQPNDPSKGKYFSHGARLAFFDDVARRIGELPGVESVALVRGLPLDGLRNTSTITIDGAERNPTGDIPAVELNLASANYFATMGIPLRAGRPFDASDDERGAPVVLVNDAFARRYFSGSDPIGRRVHFGGPSAPNPWMTIVGVVGDVLNDRLEADPRPTMYRPLRQMSSLSMAIAVRASGDLSRLGEPLSAAVRAADPDQPTYAVRTMGAVRAAATASRRFAMQLLGGFALLALVLAAIGLYGVMAYLVNQQTREIGIRMALGARPRAVIRMVVQHTLVLCAAGVVAGSAGALALAPFAARMLFRVNALDPWTYLGIGALLTATAIAAAARPARRAARVDPMVALRAE